MGISQLVRFLRGSHVGFNEAQLLQNFANAVLAEVDMLAEFLPDAVTYHLMDLAQLIYGVTPYSSQSSLKRKIRDLQPLEAYDCFVYDLDHICANHPPFFDACAQVLNFDLGNASLDMIVQSQFKHLKILSTWIKLQQPNQSISASDRRAASIRTYQWIAAQLAQQDYLATDVHAALRKAVFALESLRQPSCSSGDDDHSLAVSHQDQEDGVEGLISQYVELLQKFTLPAGMLRSLAIGASSIISGVAMRSLTLSNFWGLATGVLVAGVSHVSIKAYDQDALQSTALIAGKMRHEGGLSLDEFDRRVRQEQFDKTVAQIRSIFGFGY